MEGTVKWFNASKGYGFIEGSDGTDYFAHFQEIQTEGYKTLKEGAAVSFEPGDGEKGPVAKKEKKTAADLNQGTTRTDR